MRHSDFIPVMAVLEKDVQYKGCVTRSFGKSHILQL